MGSVPCYRDGGYSDGSGIPRLADHVDRRSEAGRETL